MKSLGPNAPKKPNCPFFVFMKQLCSQNNEINSLPFMERRSHASKIWNKMSKAEQKVYKDQSHAEQREYEKQLAEYKKTDEYKQWQIKYANSKAARGKNGKSGRNMADDDDRINDEFTSKFRRIEIFTPNFLDYNRQRETQLRNLRKEVTKQEEETASFSAHIDGLSSANAAMTQQIKAAEDGLSQEQNLVSKFHAELAVTFSSLQLPNLESSPRSPSGSNDRINPNNVDAYLSKLSEVINSGRNEALKVKAKECLMAALQSKSLSMCSV